MSMPDREEIRCETCKYFEPPPERARIREGECRFLVPVPDIMTTVSTSYWCGQHSTLQEEYDQGLVDKITEGIVAGLENLDFTSSFMITKHQNYP